MKACYFSGRSKEVESGARNVDHILSGTMLPDLAGEILTRTVEGRPFKSVHVSGGREVCVQD
jgi:type VI secretion system protein VasG